MCDVRVPWFVGHSNSNEGGGPLRRVNSDIYTSSLKKKKKVVRMTCLVFCVSLNHHFVLNGRIKVNNVWNGMRVRKVQAELSFLAKFLLITR